MKKQHKAILLLFIASVLCAMLCIGIAADGAAEPTPWAPEAESGVTYAVFADEAAYNSGADPVATSTATTITSAETRALGGRYLIVYAKTLTYSGGTNNIINSGSLVINCNGNTFSAGADTNMLLTNSNIGIEVTFKNGTLVCKQLQFRYFKNLSFENMTCNIYELGYAAGGNLTATNSTFNLSKNMYLSNANGYSSKTNFSFNGCRINFNGNAYKTDASKIASDSRYYENSPIVILQGNASAKVNVSFDGDCIISMPNQKTAAILTVINQTANATAQNITVSYADGIKFDRHIIPDETYAIKPYGKTAYEIHEDDGTVSLGTGEFCYAIKDSNGFYAITPTLSGDNVAWLTYNKGSKVAICQEATYIEDKVILPVSELTGMSEGATLVLNMDVYTEGGSSIYRYFQKYITLDLGGHTIYSSNRWGTSEENGENFTLKNGKIISSVTQDHFLMTSMGGNASTGVINIEDLEIEHNSSSNSVFHLYGGTLNIKNSKITTTRQAVTFTEKAGACVLNADGLTAVCSSYFLQMNVNVNTKHTFEIKNSNIKASGAFYFQASTSAPTSANYLNLDISNTKIETSSDTLTYPSAIEAKLTVNLSETYLKSPINLSAPNSVNYAEGQHLHAINHATYRYRVTAPVVNMQMNLLLDSNLGVNLFIPENTNIVSVDGNAVADLTYKVEGPDGNMYYVLPIASLTPDIAAELVDLEIVFMKDEIQHTVTMALCVVDYLESLLNTEYSFYVKNLVTAIGDYIAAAYAKADKTNTALDTLRASELYKYSVADTKVAGDGVSDMQAIKELAVESARLNLEASPKMRFTIKSTFTGTLTILGKDYTVEAGLCNGLEYIDLLIAPYNLYDTVITLVAGDVSGSYSLEAYTSATLANENTTDKDAALVSAFYNYCAYADAYEAVVNK